MNIYYGGYKVKHIAQAYLWLKGIHQYLFIAGWYDLGDYKCITCLRVLTHSLKFIHSFIIQKECLFCFIVTTDTFQHVRP